MTDRIKLAVLQFIDPKTLNRPIVASLLAHEERMANDPTIQERARKIKAEVQAEMRPVIVWGMALGIVMQLAAMAMLAWYFGVRDPALEFTIPFGLSLAVVDFGIWRVVKNM